MCGIVGLFLKNPNLRNQLGAHFSTMLIAMTDRGPDSAGIAIYNRPAEGNGCKLTLFHADRAFPWRDLAAALAQAVDGDADLEIKANHAVVGLAADERAARDWLAAQHPGVRIMGYGTAMEVYKDMGRPCEVADRYDLAAMEGSHGIGHTRMATESAVTTEHSHPFTADSDTCLVHNGSLSNHNRLRNWLRRQGMVFETDNDTEVAARYFAYRLGQGAPLKEAMEAGLADLDGFYTFAMGTRDGFAVLRDGISCKPAVLAETDDWVAMASEFRSLAQLPGVADAIIWEPAPSVVYSWSLQEAA